MCPLTFWPQSKTHTCSFTFLLHDKSHALSFSFSHAVLHFSQMITVMHDLWHCPYRERTTTANSCCRPPWCWGARFATPWNRTTSSRAGWRKPGNGSHRVWTRGPTVSQCPLCFWRHLTRYLSPTTASVQFILVHSVQGGISVLGKARMFSTPLSEVSLNIAFETILVFVWLMVVFLLVLSRKIMECFPLMSFALI